MWRWRWSLVVVLGMAVRVEAAPLPALREVMQQAALRAPVVATARVRQRQADATDAAAKLSRWQNPYFEARSGVAGRNLEAQLDLWFPFEAAGQPDARRREADANRAWLQAHQSVAEAQARAWAMRAWGGAVVAAARVKILQETLQAAKTEANALDRRAKVGDIRAQDAHLARMEVTRLQVSADSAQAALQRSLAELALVLDPPPTAVEVGPELATVLPPPDAATLTGLPVVRALSLEADLHGQTRARLAAEGKPPWMLLLGTGRDVDGNPRLNAGVAWTVPTSRSNQSEQARSQAERLRALSEADRLVRELHVRWTALHREDQALAAAVQAMAGDGRSNGAQALAAVIATWRAGKAEWLQVLVARRSLAELELQQLDLLERRWALRSEWVEWTGGVE